MLAVVTVTVLGETAEADAESKARLTPLGAPEVHMETPPVKPPSVVTEMLAVAFDPCRTMRSPVWRRARIRPIRPTRSR